MAVRINTFAKPPQPGDEVQSTCWCDRSIVYVPIEEIQQGRTRPCYRVACKAPVD